MDIAQLSKMVGELILDNDRVGLPGLGTFVAEVAPASFSDKGYTINPPYRRLGFTGETLEDDILSDRYAADENVDPEVAKAFLTAFLSELKGILIDRKTVTFPGLGRLRSTSREDFFFVPDEELDIFPDGFGLDPLSLKTHHETDEEVSIAVSDLADFIRKQTSVPETPAPDETAPVETVPAEAAPSEAPTPAAPVPAKRVEAPSFVPMRVGKRHRARNWTLAILGTAVLFLAAFLILARIAPDFIDSILYTEEELRIINY